MVAYTQFAGLCINYEVYDSREIVILLCWIPLFTLPYFFTEKKIIYRIVVVLFFLEGFISLCHFIVLKGPLTASSLFILLNTNGNEAMEFLELKSGWSMLLILPYIVLFIVALRNVPQVQRDPKDKYVILLILLCSLGFLSENLVNGRLVRKGIPQTAEAFISFSDELRSYKALKERKIRSVDATFSSRAEQVFVLIIGESCSRRHMSLYNYSRKTTPKLEARNDLLVYRNVVSGYSNTLSSVLAMLTESNLENRMSIDKSVSLLDVFHSAGFKTFWLSNQSPIGIWDNGIYNLAQTADVCRFVNNNGNSSFESTYLASFDEKLFEPFGAALSSGRGNKLIVLHLMGSHSAYSRRYPGAYDKFTDASSGREKLINEYDNSVLYSDFVVDSLLNMLSAYSRANRQSNCSAVYLSDHGENVYDENENAGHDYSGSLPKVNVEVPFIVWLSPAAKTAYSDKLKTMELATDLPFVSDDLFHVVIDLNNISYEKLDRKRSLFDPGFNFKRKRILEDNMDYDLK